MTNKSAAKGTRGEYKAIEILNLYTGLDFKRVPLSGASHIKGDIFLINTNNRFCIECKNYAEDHLTSKILTSIDSQFEKWWKQTIKQANVNNQKPLLIFKYNRSKLFLATDIPIISSKFKYFILYPYNIYIAKLEDWLEHEHPEFING